jgi:hypothetical protein
MSETVEIHPVQTANRNKSGKLSSAVTLKAYEVYCHLYGEQKALVTGGCRGGFSTGELIAFLYAHSFPKTEWRSRADEALRDMKDL